MNKIQIHSVILNSISNLLIFVINVFALHLMLQGHNNPGGGFIAGLLTSVSIILLFISQGIRKVREVIKFDPVMISAFGLLLAYGTSIAPLFFGAPFLKHSFFHGHLPLLGEIHIGTPFLFDLGVYFVVVGVTSKIIMTFSYVLNDMQDDLLEATFMYSAFFDEPVSPDPDTETTEEKG